MRASLGADSDCDSCFVRYMVLIESTFQDEAVSSTAVELEASSSSCTDSFIGVPSKPDCTVEPPEVFIVIM